MLTQKLVITAIIQQTKEIANKSTLGKKDVDQFFELNFPYIKKQDAVKVIVENIRRIIDNKKIDSSNLATKKSFNSQFDDVYKSLFGNIDTQTANKQNSSKSRTNIIRDNDGNLKPSQDILIQWPFARGSAEWLMNGYHVQGVRDSNNICIDNRLGWCAMTAQDMQLRSHRSQGYPADNRNAKIYTAISGPIKRISSCAYQQYSPDREWLILYYHMNAEDSSIPIGNSVYRSKNRQFGLYADQYDEAICTGGNSTGPHLHWNIYHKDEYGDYTPVDFKYLVVSGWASRTTFGAQSYSNNCALFFAYEYGNYSKIHCPYQSSKSIANPINLDTDGDCILDENDIAFLDPDLPRTIENCTNQPPEINQPVTPQIRNYGEVINLLISATDPNGDQLFYNASNLPPGLTIQPDGIITGALTAAGEYSTTILVSDGVFTVSAVINWIISKKILLIEYDDYLIPIIKK